MCIRDSTRGGAIQLSTTYSNIIEDCDFTNNSTTDFGGAIYNISGQLTITNCDFVLNFTSATEAGGAIFGTNSAGIQMTNSFFYDNASGAGGAVNWRGDAGGSFLNIIDNCDFTTNNALINGASSREGGGALYFEKDVSISNSKFVGNSVPTNAWGGAIQLLSLIHI